MSKLSYRISVDEKIIGEQSLLSNEILNSVISNGLTMLVNNDSMLLVAQSLSEYNIHTRILYSAESTLLLE